MRFSVRDLRRNLVRIPWVQVQTPALFFLVLLTLTALPGCQPIKFTEKTTLMALETKNYQFSAPRYDQRVVVRIQPTSQPVSAYIVRAADLEDVEMILNKKETPPASKVFAYKVSTGKPEEYDFETTIPAGVEYRLLIVNSGKQRTEVQVSLAGR